MVSIRCLITGHKIVEGSARLFGLVPPLMYCKRCGKLPHMNIKEADVNDTIPEKNTDHKEEDTSRAAESNT